jgi:Ig domain of plant-specific actin-binding protein
MKKLTIGAAFAAVLVLAGIAYAAVSAVTDRPTAKVLPSITGTPRQGDTLTASEGTWERADGGTTFAYQWQRCDAAGANCANIAGATSKAYLAQGADVGRTLRVEVAATDNDGSSQTVSATTRDIVAAGADPTVRPAGAQRLQDGSWSIPASSVALPERLNIQTVQFQPSVIRSRTPFTARFRVQDSRGFWVRDALVYAAGVPWSRITTAPEAKTDVNGWAQIQFTPTTRLQLKRGHFIVMFVRARKDGGDLLAGVSTRRLVQIRVSTPAA